MLARFTPAPVSGELVGSGRPLSTGTTKELKRPGAKREARAGQFALRARAESLEWRIAAVRWASTARPSVRRTMSPSLCGEHGGLRPLPRAGKAACADALSLPRRVGGGSRAGHQALAARLWW